MTDWKALHGTDDAAREQARRDAWAELARDEREPASTREIAARLARGEDVE